MEAVCTATSFLKYPHDNVIVLSQFQRNNASIGCRTRQRMRNGQIWVPLRVVAKEATMTPSPAKEGRDNDSYDCVVVGGGISGLTTAQALATRHSSSVKKLLLTEAKHRVGGNIITVEKDGYLWEEGPNSFQPSDAVLALLVDLGLKDELILGDPNAPRFVLWKGKLRPVPSGPKDILFFDLMSFGGKLRAAFGALGLRPPPPGREESVEEFVCRNLGDEVFERLIEPFCSGVYAGDPAKLSMKAAFGKVCSLEENGGSIIGGAVKRIQESKNSPRPPRDPRLPKPKGQTVGSFKKGLATIPNAIANRLGDKVKLGWKLLAVKKISGCGYALTYETPDGSISIQTKTVVLTVPSYVASNILRPLSVTAADSLSQFYYPPVAVVSVSYPKSAIKNECLINDELKGFGQLHPRSQGIETLGTIYSSSLFTGRAPLDRVLLLNFIGGATNPDITEKVFKIKRMVKFLRENVLHPGYEVLNESEAKCYIPGEQHDPNEGNFAQGERFIQVIDIKVTEESLADQNNG